MMSMLIAKKFALQKQQKNTQYKMDAALVIQATNNSCQTADKTKL